MSTQINDNIITIAPKAIDDRLGKWEGGEWLGFTTTVELLAATPMAMRYRGMTLLMNISGVQTEYWFLDGIEDWNLIEKSSVPSGGTSSQYLRGDKSWQTLDTDAVVEATNLYFTESRVRAVITTGTNLQYFRGDQSWQTLDTDAVVEATNLYFTESRVRAVITTGTNLQYFRGDQSWQTLNTDAVVEATNLYFTESRVRAAILTGLNITGSSISSTDSILQAFGKLQNQINGVLGGAIYQGVYNATTNSPTLADGSGTKGYYYVVSVAGSINLGSGVINFNVGDWCIYNGAIWEKVDNTDAVSSVNGYIGAVNLVTADIPESTNLYYTNARARAAISGTSPIAYDNSTGVISIGILPIANGGTNSNTALSNNRIIISSASKIVEATAITANRAIVSDANGIPIHSNITDTEIGYLNGVSSNIQSQLNSINPAANYLFLYYNFY